MDPVKLKFITAMSLAAALFCALTLLRLTLVERWTENGKHLWLREVARDIALALGPLAVLILVWEFWLREPRLEEMQRSVRLWIESENTNLASLRRSGLKQVWSSGGNNQTAVRNFMLSARKRVVFLAPWFLDPTVMQPMLTDLAKRGVSVEILLCSPNSAYAVARGEMIGKRPDYGPSEVKRSLDALMDARRDCRCSGLTAKVFETTPAVYLVLADDRVLIGFFSHVGTALETPLLESELLDDSGKETQFGEFAEGEIQKVEGLSTAVDLSGNEWRIMKPEEPKIGR